MVISEQQVNSQVIIEKMVGRFDQNACQESTLGIATSFWM
jgi:hypothetical protein